MGDRKRPKPRRMLYTQKGQRRKQQGGKPEDKHHGVFRKAALLKRMVIGRHQEQSLPVRELEIPDLQHDGSRLKHEHAACKQHRSGQSDKQPCARHKRTEKKRACIPHKYLGRVMVEEKEAKHCAKKRSTRE